MVLFVDLVCMLSVGASVLRRSFVVAFCGSVHMAVILAGYRKALVGTG